MKQKLLLLPICVTLATPLATANPGGPPPGGGGGPPMADPVSDALDRNHDGELSKHEIKRAPRVLKRLDRNRDGELTGEEIGQPEEDKGQPGPPPSEAFMALDFDDDGTLSSAEIEKAADSLATLDIDGDGELSSEEFGSQPAQGNDGPPQGGQGGQAGGNQGHGPPPGPRRR